MTFLCEVEALRNLQSSGLFEDDRKQKVLESLTQNQKEVFSVLTNEPTHIDELIKITGIGVLKPTLHLALP